MRFLLHTTASPSQDLALEETIQRGMEAGTSAPTWRLWQAAQPAVILGTGQKHELEVNMDFARVENIPVLRRHSGGGAVLIGPGVINYSGFFYYEGLPGSDTITGAMKAGLQPVVRTLASLGVQVDYVGLSDLAVVGAGGGLRKICGNSQARKRRSVVVHGTMLADPDWAMLERLLKFPSKVPDYRAGRDHRAFLTSLREQGAPFELAAFADAFVKQMGPDVGATEAPLKAEIAAADDLHAEKYARDDWNLRR